MYLSACRIIKVDGGVSLLKISIFNRHFVCHAGCIKCFYSSNLHWVVLLNPFPYSGYFKHTFFPASPKTFNSHRLCLRASNYFEIFHRQDTKGNDLNQPFRILWDIRKHGLTWRCMQSTFLTVRCSIAFEIGLYITNSLDVKREIHTVQHSQTRRLH